MFEPVLQVFGVLDTLAFRHPLRLVVALVFTAAIWLLLRRTFVSFPDAEQRRAFERSVKLRRFMIGFSRTIIVVLVCIVFAAPYVTFPELIASEPKAVVLVDQTASMGNADTAGVDRFIDDVGSRIATEVYPLERSDWDAVRSYIEEGTPVIIASDGMLSGDGLAIARYARALNSSISFIELPDRDPDLAVSIEAPALTTARIDTPITINVEGNELARDLEYELVVRIDDAIVRNLSGRGPNAYELMISSGAGDRVVSATIITDDAFVRNNDARHALLVSDRPEVHLVTRDPSSPLARTLGELYTLTVSSRIPALDEVSALVIDNAPASDLDARYDELSSFVLDGGGLVLIGGDRSFDRGEYRGSRIETLLPVVSEKGAPEGDGTLSVVLIIDMSASTGQVFREGSLVTVVDIIKSGAVSVYDALKESDYAGVVVFNTEPRILQSFSLKNEQAGTTGRIRSLMFLGGTFIHSGMDEAARMLSNAPGTKYAILFSDGDSQSVRRDRDAAIALRNVGVTLHAVSIGDGSDRDHLFDLARITGGTLFEPEETDRFEILFGTHDEPVEPDAPLVVSIVPWDTNHFVSSGLALGSRVYGFNDVVPKQTAQQLVVTTSNNPIVASTFFGLGRIVTISTDNGRQWSGEVFERDSVLVSRSVNYALGDASKQQDFFIKAEDPREGEVFEALIYAQAHIPSIEVLNETVLLSQIDEGEYRAQLELARGVYTIGPRSLSVNYEREYTYPAVSLRQVAFASAGEAFALDDPVQVERYALENSFESTSRVRPIPEHFLFFAAIIFLIEVIIRRLTQRRPV